NTIANPKGELKAITTRSGLVTEGPTVSNPPKSVNPDEDECVEETYTDPDHAKYNIKVPPPLPVQKPKPPIQINFVLHTRDSLPPSLLSNKEKLQELANTALNENCSAVILKKLLEKLGDPGKFLIPYGFSELKCKSLADLGASINLMPLATRALIDVYGEEMILRDGDERLTLNMKHDTASYSNHPYRESVKFINIFNLSSEDCLKDLDSHKQNGNLTFSLHKEIASPKVIPEIHDSKGCSFLS
nr:reverse transcriptase domain-containing protein [Tanacetum cinerariifolium]